MAKLFSDREIRAIAVFLPLAGLLIIALMLVRPAAAPEAARRKAPSPPAISPITRSNGTP